jgi:putative Holliday junction resolvase
MSVDVENHIIFAIAQLPTQREKSSIASPFGFVPNPDFTDIGVAPVQSFIALPDHDLANRVGVPPFPTPNGRRHQHRISDEGGLNEQDSARVTHVAKIRVSFAVIMARWIGLDLGQTRTGIAVTDREGIIASPLETVTTSQLMKRLKLLIEQEPCAGLVLGHPGPTADSTPLVEQWIDKLKRAFPGRKLVLIDEQNSSREARMAMVMGGLPKKKREQKGEMDKIAAAIILQRFLASDSPR